MGRGIEYDLGSVLLQVEMEHERQSLEKDKIKTLGAQQMWVTSMLANSEQQSRSSTLREIYIHITQ